MRIDILQSSAGKVISDFIMMVLLVWTVLSFFHNNISNGRVLTWGIQYNDCVSKAVLMSLVYCIGRICFTIHFQWSRIIFYVIIGLIALRELLFCMMQFLHGNGTITGSMGNTGLLGGFISVCLCFFGAGIVKDGKYFRLLFLLPLLVLEIISFSRAAWLSCAIVAGVLLFRSESLNRWNYKWKIPLFLSAFYLGIIVYYLKKESADSRLFMALLTLRNCTKVGLLGTDGFVKTLPQLYAKTKALCQDGISAYMLTGYYGLPTPTITSSIAEDLIYLDRCIGCKIAMSDDRSSHPTKQELLRIIQQVRLGGFTSAKGGIMHVHLGALPTGIDLLLEIAREYPSLISYISPTHMGRTHELFLQAIDFARLGGMIDISTGGTKYCEPYLSVLEGLEAGIDIHQMTFSSDGNAGVRRRNAETGEDTYLVAPLHKNLEQVVCLIREAGLSPADAFSLITTNPARNMHLTGKGRIAEGGDADITLFDDQWKLQGVWARGVEMMREGVVLKKGNFES